jgi:tetratricopeptide (TPR) repeat protein
VADLQRLDELRRRVQRDPASLAFAQLAEECRRAGLFEESVRVCREGLAHHPDYLSAHVTLGRALVGLGHLDQASAELSGVLRTAPENLAALRGLAEVFHLRGMDADALDRYRTALALAPHDMEIAAAIESLERAASPRLAGAMPAAAGADSHAAPMPPPSPPVPDAFPDAREAAGPASMRVGAPPRGRAAASAAIVRLERWLRAIDARRARRAPAGPRAEASH